MEYDDTPVTPDEIRTVAAKLTDKDFLQGFNGQRPMKRAAFTAIFEAAFSTPTRGLSYPDEIHHLQDFVYDYGETHTGDDLDLRLLAMAFSTTFWWTRCEDDSDPWMRDAARDLIRDVAKYLARIEAHSIAQCAREDARELAQERGAVSQ
jgi:hypothetical protein